MLIKGDAVFGFKKSFIYFRLYNLLNLMYNFNMPNDV